MDALNSSHRHADFVDSSGRRDSDVSHGATFPAEKLSCVSRPAPHAFSAPAGPNEKVQKNEENASALVVDWDGPDDPENPKNWSFGRKWAATVIVSSFAFITPVSSSMVAPATGQLAAELGVHSSASIAFTMSIFILGYAVGPLFFGPLSEIYGRSRVLQLANLWFLAWNLACGFAQNESQIVAFRFLSGIGGSAPIAIGGGVIGDCWRVEERGQAVAVYSLAPLLGPVIGPITGAWIAQGSTWRWVFWSTSVADGVVQIFGLFFLRETYPPTLLERRAEKIRQSMNLENRSLKQVRTIFDGKEDRTWKAIFAKSMIRPFALLVQEPIIQLFGFYSAYLYGTTYLFLSIMPSIYEKVYNEPVGIAGLHYISLGVGLISASQFNAKTLDKIYMYLKNKNGGVGSPEFRLPAMFVGTMVLPIGLLITGWSVQARAHWIVSDIGIALIGVGVPLGFQSIQAYLVDSFTLYAASATAAVACLRSLCGAGFPLFAPAMYDALGYGKGCTVLAVVAIVIGCPAPWVFWHFGARIRNASRHAQR